MPYQAFLIANYRMEMILYCTPRGAVSVACLGTFAACKMNCHVEPGFAYVVCGSRCDGTVLDSERYITLLYCECSECYHGCCLCD
jgi:hypothetical protein